MCEIGKDITSELDLEKICEHINAGIKTVIGEEIYDIFLYHKETDSFEFLAYSKDTELFRERKDITIRKDGIGREVVKKGEPIIIDVQTDPRAHPVVREKGFQTTACFSLKFKEEVIGVLYLHFKKKRELGQDDKVELEMFADQLAIAIKNAEVTKERLLSLTQIARELGHQIRNPLTPIEEAAKELKELFSKAPANIRKELDKDMIKVCKSLVLCQA